MEKMQLRRISATVGMFEVTNCDLKTVNSPSFNSYIEITICDFKQVL
jgi:hypothetical protein